ncbi:flagellar assembly protein FliW [Bacillus chungangensis]|uniref:Flagellar assembly factor FliW n=1 Tax=Bacillus chungangensis TaxID=587633 RepID=A0ABT9WUW6_9BACI|nr:flagellar assembly protein FliW [Bacillus chungangensis]MDQ0177084.1 flagellar assembly factor FliW [Bacillus chungangensis]
MKIETKYHGEIVIKESDIWKFYYGLPGFPDETAFVMLPLPNNDLFFVLQSIANPLLGFVITNPFSFFPDYHFKLDDQTLEQLKIAGEEDVNVHIILTVQKPFSETTANLRAPLIFNMKEKQAKQIILNEEHYTTKHLLFQTPAGKAGE